MPQTREAIAHAQAARVPIVVALNKIDRPDANPDFVKKQLGESGLVPDEWGGNTLIVPVSAKQKMGIDDLLEAILLVADSIEINANPRGKVIGTVIESEVDRSKGVVATLLIQNGTLQVGDIVVTGLSHGKLRAMFDHRGKKLHKAGPSSPVLVMGLDQAPPPGELFMVVPAERDAHAEIESRLLKLQKSEEAAPRASLEDLFNRFQSGEVKELRLIIKVDVQGSLDPILNSVKDLNKGDINVNVLYAEVGNIGENDVLLASASKAYIIGFNVQPDPTARRMADTEGVSIRLYNIIYRMIEDLEKALKGMLEPEFIETQVGKADVLAVFAISKVGNIAGCKVTQGELRRNGKYRVIRAGKVVYDGEISSLKHLKEDVREVRQGFECGVALRGSFDIAVGDILECYILERNG
jgi:translation initiation factor IF-2